MAPHSTGLSHTLPHFWGHPDLKMRVRNLEVSALLHGPQKCLFFGGFTTISRLKSKSTSERKELWKKKTDCETTKALLRPSKISCTMLANSFTSFHIFTVRLHVMQRTLLQGLAVRLSVCPSVCQTRAVWQNERTLCPHSYTTWRIIHLSSLTRRMVGGGWLLLGETLGQTDLVRAKTPIFNRYSPVAPKQ